MRSIDLNADLGEGLGLWRLTDDEGLLQVVTSANVACGFHASDPTIMRRVCAGAAAAGVTVGAQVGYRDLVGFGRYEIAMPPDRIADDVLYQLAALDGLARVEGTRVKYVKPHGALYHRCAGDADAAQAVAETVAAYDRALAVMCLPGSKLLQAAVVAGLRPIAEGFADRRYRPDGSLVPRSEAGAVIHEPDSVVAHAVEVVKERAIDSLCVHGDTPGAVTLAGRVRAMLEEAGYRVEAFA